MRAPKSGRHRTPTNVNREQQFDHAPAKPANYARVGAQNSAAGEHGTHSRLRAKLRFIRTMLWVAVYATAALFLMLVIVTDGLHLQSRILGSALILELALIAASYLWQWKG